MGYHYALVGKDHKLMIALYKKRKAKPFFIAELPPFICNIGNLQLLFEAGADADVKIEGSYRDKRKIKVTIYIDHRQVEKFTPQVEAAKARERSARKQQNDEIKALEERKWQKRQARKDRILTAIAWSTRFVAMSAKKLWASFFSNQRN